LLRPTPKEIVRQIVSMMRGRSACRSGARRSVFTAQLPQAMS
jgi:hypothetical protein